MKNIAILGLSLVVMVTLSGCGSKTTVTENVAINQPATGNVATEQPANANVEQKQKTPIEIYFDKTKAVEATATKSKNVNAIILPILKNIFDATTTDDKIIEGARLKEDFMGSMLTYVVNRPMTEVEMNQIKETLVAGGAKIIDSGAKQVTMQRESQAWVITFWLNNQEKAGLEMTF